MLRRYTPHRIALRARKEVRALAGVLREAPYQWHDVLEQARRGQLEVGFVHKGLDDLTHKLDVVFNRLVIALVVAGGLIGSSLIGIFATGGPHVLGLHVISLAGFILSGILAVWLMLAVMKSGRL
jgi:ubiquinone biosynthesis protein